MDKPYRVMDVDVLPAHFPVPKMGVLPINAFVIRAAEPVLVDTGMQSESDEFMQALRSVIDPQDLRWIWLTHDDAEHTGSIQKVLQAAPHARLATNALAALRMSTAWPVPMERVHWLTAGEPIVAGDRTLTAVRPPLFDNPTTLGLYDDRSQAFFSADCFGAIVARAVEDVDAIAPAELADGMLRWASADSPWIHMIDRDRFRQSLEAIRRISPKTIFSAHLPPARGRMEELLAQLAAVPASPPFVPPDQKMLEQILAEMRTGA